VPAIERAEVVVVGGGPAGSAAALALARAGRAVVLLERCREGGERAGETLPPASRRLLGALGIWERFQADGHAPSPGIVSLWGSDEPYENDFLCSPHGCGWHIDRRRFDQMLIDGAEQAGTRVYRPARVTDCCQMPSGGWQIEALVDGERVQLTTGFLVEATGRAAPPAHHDRSTRISYDRLIGLVGFLGTGASFGDDRTLVEASEHGWWYSARLPQGRLVAAYMTDADLIARDRLPHVWQEQLRQAPYTRERVRSYDGEPVLRIAAAHTYRRRGIVGRNCLVVGDAAVAFDPLSSQGLSQALEGGLLAADVIGKAIHGATGVLDEYARQVARGFDVFLRARAEYYGREQRWPESLFWRRRQHSPQSTDPAPPTSLPAANRA
jgi:flavin-dependent dehydrogenase